MATAKAQNTETLRRNEEKWSPTLMEAGWTVLPSIILEKQHALGLDAIDVNILMHLARYWWFSDNPPHPSKATIAKCMNISTSTVRKRIKRMESEGLIQRQKRFNHKDGGQESNAYLFKGLIETVTPHAKEALEMREKQHAENEARKNRKKVKSPGPVLVK